MPTEEKAAPQKKLRWTQILLSVCGAFLGVQSAKNLRTDFHSDRLWPYIIIALVVVSAFILLLVLVVKIILYVAI